MLTSDRTSVNSQANGWFIGAINLFNLGTGTE